MHEGPSRAKHVHAFVEGGFADAVVYHVHAFAHGEAFGFGFEIGLGVENDLIRAGVFRELSFRFGRYGADDARAQVVRHLDQQKADTSGSGVHQGGVTGLERISVVRQVVCGHALEDGSGGLGFADALRNGHQSIGEGGDLFGVRTEHAAPRDPIAGFGGFDVLADGGDDARALLARNKRHGRGVAAGAHVDVNVVDSRGGNCDQSFVPFGVGDGQIR